MDDCRSALARIWEKSRMWNIGDLNSLLYLNGNKDVCCESARKVWPMNGLCDLKGPNFGALGLASKQSPSGQSSQGLGYDR